MSEVSAGAARPHHSSVSATLSPPLPHAHSPPTPAPFLRLNVKINAWTNPSARHTHSHITLNFLPLLLELSVQMSFCLGSCINNHKKLNTQFISLYLLSFHRTTCHHRKCYIFLLFASIFFLHYCLVRNFVLQHAILTAWTVQKTWSALNLHS